MEAAHAVSMALLVLFALSVSVIPVQAAHPVVGSGASANLPYTISDGKSFAWIIQGGGWLQHAA